MPTGGVSMGQSYITVETVEDPPLAEAETKGVAEGLARNLLIPLNLMVLFNQFWLDHQARNTKLLQVKEDFVLHN